LPGWRPIVVPAGELRFSGLREGIRAWLAVEGGFDVPLLMGSRSTDLRGGFGGVDGRALRAGDRVPVGACDAVFSGDSGADQAVAAPRIAGWWVGRDDHRLGTAGPVRFVASLHPLSAGLSGRKWQVSAHSNRQGIRLQGEPLADAGHHGWSEPVAIGTIQLPPDGQPIVLMADAQTVGGYARLGHVIAADMPRLAQAGAGTTLVFEQVGMDEARGISRQQRQQHARTCIAIGQRLG
ncbi:MAG TPA: biotin-dependent carboxyltransferase family protein, partial [Pseudoxanthomonas sp.]|nr:biotin-dependent carboxyltransferase family protein [Pseudoxanthomonas sp.]